jgi:MerR family transcriptional regulator/heat shock protein HspR
MVGVHAQTLRYYEKMGLVEPSRSSGNIRLYSERDIARLRQIKTLMGDLGVNLAGVEVILRLTERMAEMQRHIEELRRELQRLREASSAGGEEGSSR